MGPAGTALVLPRNDLCHINRHLIYVSVARNLYGIELVYDDSGLS